MDSKILLNVRPHQIRMACIKKGGQLKQISYHQKDNPSFVGQIFKGKVSRIQNILNFAFIDIGMKKAGFLYGKDTFQSFKPIKEILKLGQEILVQVKADSHDQKGHRLTSEISLPGFYMVLIPNHIAKVVCSRKITNEKERERLKEICTKWNIPHTIIVRTLARGKKEDILKRDLEILQKQWENLQKKFKQHKGEGTLQESDSPVINYLKNYFSEDIQMVLIDEDQTYLDIKNWLEDNGSKELVRKIKKYSKSKPLFKEFLIENQIKNIQSKKVYLKNGGSLIFEETEAFVVIDVNTARYKGQQNVSKSVLAMNLEAARVIAEQIVLRELGGIILIDFIDMDQIKDREAVVACLDKSLKEDKTQTQVFPMGELGLVQITRKRRNASMVSYLNERCGHCKGQGQHKTMATLAGEVLTQMEDVPRPLLQVPLLSRPQKLKITCHPRLSQWIQDKALDSLRLLKNKLKIEAYFEDDPKCSPQVFKIKKI